MRPEEAQAIVAAKKNLRLLIAGGLPDPRAPGETVRALAGGLLVQGRDNGRRRRHAAQGRHQARADASRNTRISRFAYRVAKHVKSNAIVYAKDGATVGIGAGQMSRVDSSRIAAWKAAEAAKRLGLAESLARGSVVASDAFFPFADGLLAAVEAGATAVIQPGGSMRDEEVIARRRRGRSRHGLHRIATSGTEPVGGVPSIRSSPIGKAPPIGGAFLFRENRDGQRAGRSSKVKMSRSLVSG